MGFGVGFMILLYPPCCFPHIPPTKGIVPKFPVPHSLELSDIIVTRSSERWSCELGILWLAAVWACIWSRGVVGKWLLPHPLTFIFLYNTYFPDISMYVIGLMTVWGHIGGGFTATLPLACPWCSLIIGLALNAQMFLQTLRNSTKAAALT